MKLKVEILNLDALASEANIVAAIRKDLSSISGEPKVTIYSPNKREQRKAVVEMKEKDGLLLLRSGKIKIG